MIFFFFYNAMLGSTSFINFAYLQVIYNHIDYVSHYFRKIWAIVRWWHNFHIIIFLLKPISRDLRWRKLSWLIDSYRVQLQCIVNALRNSAGVHARATAILRLVTGAARDRIPPAGRRIAIFQSHTHGQSGKYRQLQHLGKPFALVNKTSRNTFLTSVLIGKTPLKALYLKYTQYYTRYVLLTSSRTA